MTGILFGLGWPELLMIGGFIAVAAAIAFLMFYHPKGKNPLEGDIAPVGKYGAAIRFDGMSQMVIEGQVYSPLSYDGQVINVHRNWNGTNDITVEDSSEHVTFTIHGAVPGLNYYIVESANTLVGKSTYHCNMDRTSLPFPWNNGRRSANLEEFQQRVIEQAKVDAEREALETAEYRESVNPPEAANDRQRLENRRIAMQAGLEKI
jgi:hypothetical protein